MTPPESTRDQPIRVLLVDDDEDDYRLTRAILEEIPGTQFRLDWKPEYKDALEAMLLREHDVYLVDYRLGERTGLDLLAELKARKSMVPVILLTGQGELEVDRAAELAGAADYLEKSRLDPIILERMIRYAVRQFSQEAELEKKVATRTAELETANQALHKADRLKDEFLATLAHELRNPLAPIRNALQIQRMVAGDPEATEQARAMIERQVAQLVRLIDDLLDASQLSRGKLRIEMESVDLRDSLDVAVEASRPLLERAILNFRCDYASEKLPLRGDRVRLTQLFTNLLNNAAKYTQTNGKVSLTGRIVDTNLCISVSDNGVGIPTRLLPRVFDLFTQIDRTLNRSEGGLGIGLALVKRIVEMHQGVITAESGGVNCGTTFIVTLPMEVS